MSKPFWQTKSLAEMSTTEWESVCDGCGRCCVHKLEDAYSGTLFYTCVACELLDVESGRCLDYPNRQKKVPDCVQLNQEKLSQLDWLPQTCGYRLLAEGKSLPPWHPLRSGTQDSVRAADISIAGKVLRESDVDLDSLEDYIIDWIE